MSFSNITAMILVRLNPAYLEFMTLDELRTERVWQIQHGVERLTRAGFSMYLSIRQIEENIASLNRVIKEKESAQENLTAHARSDFLSLVR